MFENIKSVGLKDMHHLQVQALMDLIGMTLKIAAQTKNLELLQEVESECDELVKLFGGAGVSVTIETS